MVSGQVPVQVSSNDVGSFLAVFAALLLDNVLRLDETVGRVTDLVIGSGRPDKELIVTLQSFDRLKQEFEALGDALTRYARGDEFRSAGGRGARATRAGGDRRDHACRAQGPAAVPAPGRYADRSPRRQCRQQLAAELDVDVEF